MSGSIANANNTYISMTAGSAGAVGSGAYTIAVLAQPAGNNFGYVSTLASGTMNRELLQSGGALFGQGDFSSGFGTLTGGTWYVAAQSKAAGANTYRHHVWAYASDGSGTMSHGVATGSGTHGDGSTATELRVGSNDTFGAGLIAVVAFWTRVLADAELDSMKSGSLTAWRDVSGGQPAELISLETWNGSTGCTAVIGTSSQSSVSGTITSGANPPSFNFSLAGGSVVAPPVIVAPSLAVVRASTW